MGYESVITKYTDTRFIMKDVDQILQALER